MSTGDAEERERLRRFREGQRAATERQQQLVLAEGPRNREAVAEALSAFDMTTRGTKQPSRRDPVSEGLVAEVRRRWVRIQRRAREAS